MTCFKHTADICTLADNSRTFDIKSGEIFLCDLEYLHLLLGFRMSDDRILFTNTKLKDYWGKRLEWRNRVM